MVKLDEYWERVQLGERFDVHHPFFEGVVDEVWRMVRERGWRMLDVVRVGGGYLEEDVRQEVVLGLVGAWGRVDWSLGRRACFWFFVQCGLRVLQQLYRRYRRRVGWESLDGLMERVESLDVSDEERLRLESLLSVWDREVCELLWGDV